MANQDRATRSDTMLNFLYYLGFQQRVMYISSNNVPSQNQLAMGGVTHKLIYMLKPFDFINVGQYPLSYSNTPPHVWATNKVQHVHIILIKPER